MSPIIARRRAGWLSTLGAILLPIALNLEDYTWMLILGLPSFVSLLAGIIIAVRFYRCPHCRERLPRKNAYADDFSHCPYCGKPLE